ncbi:signal recognition particle-docking protein FtsY [Streptococcus sp. 27098_8_75]|jgi:signal recognition particle-docking protein ftsY|uniref:signal recognition particle-docking protein FtsY n=1 Tax=Streptococcus TaxID=1301 RepID=UPI0007797D4C|nr:signal recognition particle-docking protein FtsY [Streptococcus gordonii]ATF65730.1 signal recognition particle-docking protein FtsY [Streptococcus gordonii]MBZ2131730.1 signal recognition particle-docking protein FtsY [Streptococcus gordonii]MCC3174646.1 signal recognition particle-docking protein FtsY [Streptococcus gordonii]MCY7132060.1 signal recognition particle-docking protein FtsY [Streptococcus gordonii]MCY7142304.1 signal recognition particle-docking protein FtsY [Streptococcus gor
MGLFDRLFGRKKEKKEDIREEELVQTEASETEDAIEELENENQSQVENAPEESSQEEIIPFEEEDKQEFYEELEERLSEDQVLNEVIEDKTQNRFVEQEADELQQEETEESVSIAEKSEEAQIDNSSEEELAEESVPVQEGSEEKQSELDSETPALEDIKLEDQGPLTVDEPGQADEDAKDSNQAEAVEEEKQDLPDEAEQGLDTSEEAEVTKSDQEEVHTETVQEKYDRSLKKTRTGFGAKLNAFFANFRTVDEDFFEDLEELLITSDVGVQVASNLAEELRYEARLENAKKPDALRKVIIEKLVDIYEKDGRYNEKINFQDGLTVMLFVGVNGVGKTTSIGKLAYKYKQEGKKVMLVAADTFRAGAVAQLAEWGKRVDVPVVTGPEKCDPASVVFDGMERAQAENVDILMIDTAGRLQNKDNLMAELEKIGRIIKRVNPDAPHETFLALDASTGQNALVQAKEFSKITPVTGIVLTKIDGTARGGVVLAIRQELDIPVKLIGFGEKIDDIGEFNSENFMRGLLEGLL